MLIETLDIHKHFGVTFDNKLSFNSHIDCITSDPIKNLVSLKRFAFKWMERYFLVYTKLILPLLECSNLCFIPTQTQNINLEKYRKNHKIHLF